MILTAHILYVCTAVAIQYTEDGIVHVLLHYIKSEVCDVCCREGRVKQRETELSERERELERRQNNFQQWMREQQNSIQQRSASL